jgi:hypothetical protein
MADTGSTFPQDPNVQDVEEKGKGKAISEDVPQDDVMDDDEDDDSSDDEENEVSNLTYSVSRIIGQ